ncbi:MAG: C-terminal binding protein [Planctomycetaceae bacterium]|nr:C-terminal binding protein [Planctomycetaceae bacterium]
MSAPYRVLLTDRAWPSLDLEREILASGNAEVIESPDDSEATLISLAADVDAIATCWAQVTGRVIEAAPKCKIIARLGIGLDNIDIPTATRLKIPVTNVPDYCIPEVADHTCGLILALNRKITFFDREAKQGRYKLSAAGPLRRLAGQTLGLIGFGRIARAVRERALGFGLEVIAHSPSGRDYGCGCEMVSLEALLKRSDIVSLHAPHTDASHHLLNREMLSRIKPGALVINTSRGGLIDHQALWESLKTDHLAGVALDVFDPEPPDLSDPMFADHRVVVTPHAAFTSEESLVELRTRVCQQILTTLQGGQPENLVNSENLEELTNDNVRSEAES